VQPKQRRLMEEIKEGFEGIVDIPEEVYRPLDAVNQSNLKELLNSYDKYNHMKNFGISSDALIFGSAFHSYIEDENKFKTEYAIAPNCRKGSKEWKEFESNAGKKKILKAQDLDLIKEMHLSLATHPIGSQLLSDGLAVKEHCFFWNRSDIHLNRIWCKAKFDMHTSANYLVDWKTTKDASPDGFLRQVKNYKMNFQAAYYMSGMEALGHPVEGFIFAAVEKHPPHTCGFYLLSEESIAKGKELVEIAFQKYSTFNQLNSKGELNKSLLHQGYNKNLVVLDTPTFSHWENE